MIRLEMIHEYNLEKCLNLNVSDQQTQFISSNKDVVSKAYVHFNQTTPLAIYNSQKIIGFILLRFNPDYNNYVIMQFMIDHSEQGKGYGKEALKLAIEWMKMDPRCTEIITTYKDENERAFNLYKSLNFNYFEQINDTILVKLAL